MDNFEQLIQKLFKTFVPPPAYSRVTRTPIYFQDVEKPWQGMYRSDSGNIIIDKGLNNLDNLTALSKMIRHESAHALLEPYEGIFARDLHKEPNYNLDSALLVKSGYQSSQVPVEIPAYAVSDENWQRAYMDRILRMIPDSTARMKYRLLGK